jgi:hypothetical protein
MMRFSATAATTQRAEEAQDQIWKESKRCGAPIDDTPASSYDLARNRRRVHCDGEPLIISTAGAACANGNRHDGR